MSVYVYVFSVSGLHCKPHKPPVPVYAAQWPRPRWVCAAGWDSLLGMVAEPQLPCACRQVLQRGAQNTEVSLWDCLKQQMTYILNGNMRRDHSVMTHCRIVFLSSGCEKLHKRN